MARPGIAHVFCFENRGEEIGVTLTHPHGQIYGYPYLPPRAALMLREARAHADRTGSNLFTDILAARWPTAAASSRGPTVHRIRTVRGTLAGRGTHLSEPVRAQPR